MKNVTRPAFRAVLMGFTALLLVLTVEGVVSTIHQGDYRFLGVDLFGYVLLAAVLTLPIAVAKFSLAAPGGMNLLAGIGMGVPGCLVGLHLMSPDPRTWVWLIGRPMLWMYVGLALLFLIMSLWTQSAALWFGHRRLIAALVAFGSIVLVVAVWAAGFGLMRFADARARVSVASAAQHRIDLPLPKLALTAMDGTPISVSELSGYITVIDFWGTWCGACIAEFPSIEAVKQEYSGNSRVHFLLVNPEIEGDTPEKIKRFLQQSPISVPLALDPGTSYFEVSEKMNSKGLPLLLVVDQHGRVRFREIGFESDYKTKRELHGEINALLAEN